MLRVRERRGIGRGEAGVHQVAGALKMTRSRKTSLGAFKRQLRLVAKTIFAEKQGVALEELTAKGIQPAARWRAKPANGPAFDVAVRTSNQRTLGFSRLPEHGWRTLEKVKWVLDVVPHRERPGDFEVLAFESKMLKGRFGKALQALENAGRSPDLDVPIFIPLDEKSKKNLGHDIAGLKDAARWCVEISAKQLLDQRVREGLEAF